MEVIGTSLLCVIGAPLILLFAAIWHFSGVQCPGCKRRRTIRWVHERKDGGPDRRYNDNYRYCTWCRWNELTGSPRPPPTPDEISAQEAQRVAQQREREARVAREAPVRALVALLKRVAKADRQLTAAERAAIGAHAHRIFPGVVSDRQLELWLDDVDATDTCATYADGIDRAHWPEVLAAAEQLTLADGRATPAERRMLDEVRAALTRREEAERS